MATNYEPHECAILVHSTKSVTHENRAIHSIHYNGTLFIIDIKVAEWLHFLS